MHYQRALAALPAVVAVAAGCLCCSRAKPMEVHVTSSPSSSSSSFYRVVPSPGLAFARAETPSTACPHAAGTRSGRVSVAPHRYAAMTAVAAIADATHPAGAPRFIDVPPRGDAVVLERPGADGGTFQVLRSSGARGFDGALKEAHVLARDEALYVAGKATSWSGAIDDLDTLAYIGPGGALLSTTIQGEEVRTLTTSLGLTTHTGGPEPDRVTATMQHLHAVNEAMRVGWEYVAKEPGVGAIDGAGQAVIALPSGRLVVLAAQGDLKTAYAIVSLDVPIDAGATDLSIVPPYALVLYGGGDAGSIVQRWSQGVATSRLDARRPDGTLAWRVALPFLPTQPALDGGDHVYVVGAGITALDLSGRAVWSSASSVPLRAATFADGTLAVVRGSELQIVGADGAIRQSFRAAEELTTYPAIAADGSVWVASAVSLYAAR
jgi:hypothetical protein